MMKYVLPTIAIVSAATAIVMFVTACTSTGRARSSGYRITEAPAAGVAPTPTGSLFDEPAETATANAQSKEIRFPWQSSRQPEAERSNKRRELAVPGRRPPAAERRRFAGYKGAQLRSGVPGALPTLDEEVWVIVRSDDAIERPQQPDDAIPGAACLMTRIPDDAGTGTVDVPLPLKHTEVDGAISGYIASVNVTQEFHNPFDTKIEALYVFPLPQNAAVNGFVMTVGDRRIRGIIREKEEAKRIYEAAKAQGHVASLMTQQRANIFTQHVANIEPGKQIDIDVTYFHTLRYEHGWYEYVYPMVVGPRFNPPHTTDGIAALPRGSRGTGGQAAAVTYMRPEERSGHDIGLSLTIDAGVPIEEIACTSHEIITSGEHSAQVQVAIAEADTIPNKDFVLRYRVAGDRVKTGLLAAMDTDGSGGHFAFMMYPPQQIDHVQRRPMELIFVLDCSGSMRGEPIGQCKTAVEHALSALTPQDTFQIIRFSNDASQLGPAPLPATTGNIRKGRKYLRGLSGSGGTHMIEGIRAALDFPHDPERLRFVTFLTDGYIGNENDILGAVHNRVGQARIFSFGVGSSPNRYLMNRMAKLGRGAVAYLGLNDDGGDVFDRFFDTASRPVMTDIVLQFDGAEVRELTPGVLPDLFAGRPVIVTGRFDGDLPGALTVQGRVGADLVQSRIAIDPNPGVDHGTLAAVWARGRIADIADESTWNLRLDAATAVRGLALEYGLMSMFTSFVAVDSATITQGTHGVTVPVAVPVPDGVSYETTVGK